MCWAAYYVTRTSKVKKAEEKKKPQAVSLKSHAQDQAESLARTCILKVVYSGLSIIIMLKPDEA
jgi:hypothetical protein